jgi:hypothetical protein
VHVMKAYGGVNVQLHSVLPSNWMDVIGQLHASAPSFNKSWVGPTVCVDTLKNRLCEVKCTARLVDFSGVANVLSKFRKN